MSLQSHTNHLHERSPTKSNTRSASLKWKCNNLIFQIPGHVFAPLRNKTDTCSLSFQPWQWKSYVQFIPGAFLSFLRQHRKIFELKEALLHQAQSGIIKSWVVTRTYHTNLTLRNFIFELSNIYKYLLIEFLKQEANFSTQSRDWNIHILGGEEERKIWAKSILRESDSRLTDAWDLILL